MKLGLRDYWQRLSPKYRQAAIYAAALGAMLLLAYLFVSSGGPKPERQEKTVQRQVFTPGGFETRFGIPGLAQELEGLRRENQEIKAKLEQLLKQRGGSPQEQQQELNRLVEKRLEEFKKGSAPPPGGPAAGPLPGGPGPGTPGPAPATTPPGLAKGQKVPDWLLAQEKPGAAGGAKAGRPGALPTAALAAPHVSKDIREISAVTQEAAAAATGAAGAPGRIQALRREKTKEEVEKVTYLPAGSIFSGTLLTGMDAACGDGAKKDPFPALLRLKKEAILPNRYSADVRECFMVASGYGDLSSERAYLRAERLSCIRADSKALETKIEMYAVGEDGKAGVRGKLVSKQGQVIGRALLLGFMKGVSQIFQQIPTSNLYLSGPGMGAGATSQTAPFQSYLSKPAFETMALSGVGSSLDQLIQYYKGMADKIFPVVEIDAGRQVDFVLISGVKLQLQGKT